MRMLAALCVVSIIAMIHANQYIKPENNGNNIFFLIKWENMTKCFFFVILHCYS
jgi:hypothetical protein